MKTLTLIDGSGFIFRAYHSLPPLTNPDGVPVGAVYGFVNMMSKFAQSTQIDAIAVVFDVSRITFRNRIYADYKAHRPPPPDDLIPQFALTREAAKALNLPVVELADYEADDLIASYAKAGKAAGMKVTVISSDKDLMQLVDDDVQMYDPMKQKPIGIAEVEAKFGVKPNRVLDILSLMGDSSDNIPGVPGIGPKTATELINSYGDLDALLERAGEIKQNKRRENLIEFADQARMSRELARLAEDVELPLSLDELAMKKPEAEVLLGFLEAQGFRSLMPRMKERFQFPAEERGSHEASETQQEIGSASPRRPAQGGEYHLVQTEVALDEWILRAQKAGRVAVDTETTGLDALTVDLVGISLSVQAGEACYIPVGHLEKGSAANAAPADDLFAEHHAPKQVEGQLDKNLVLEKLAPLLANESVLKIGQNIKYDINVLLSLWERQVFSANPLYSSSEAVVHQKVSAKKTGEGSGHDIKPLESPHPNPLPKGEGTLSISPIDDTMLISYALNAGAHSHGMDELANRYLGITPISYDTVTGKGKARISFAEVELETARDYAAEDADLTLRLWETLKPQLHQKQLLTLYETIERPLVPVIAAMEQRGVKVDVMKLKSLSHDFATEMMRLEKEIHDLAGEEFNVASPKQLGEILFDKMELEGGKKSKKTGAYSTGAEILEKLAEEGVELAGKVLEHRQLAKLKNTYTDALVNQVNPNTGRVHTSFSLATTSTGRLSSSDPNLQNIPIRTELGRKIRTCFIAEEGNVLIAADYSQIELRLLAHMAEIDTLKTAFKEGRDIHATTAADMFGVAIDAVDSELRRRAKMINFGIIYGISAHGLATRLGISRPEAADYIEAYFQKYPGIRAYMEETKTFAREHGYVKTLYGRRCHLPNINASNGMLRQFSERAAINAPLQGTAADIIKRAMVKVEAALKPSPTGTRADIYAGGEGSEATETSNAISSPAALTPGTRKKGTAVPFSRAPSLSQREREKGCRMLLQVHDELLFEVKASEAEAAIKQIVPLMENAAHLSIPLTVDAKSGSHWGEAH